MEDTTLILDGDIFAYQAAVVNEYNCQWDDWLWTRHAELPPAIETLDDRIGMIADDLEATRVVIALTAKDNWRKDIFPEYKSHRKDPKPVIYGALREYLHETRETFERPTLEGDDILGILSTHPKMITGKKIIVSLDKDMTTIPGLLLNDGKARDAMKKDKSLFYEDFVEEVTEQDADYKHMMQTLTGDTSDGYPGCPGIGKVTAEKILRLACFMDETQEGPTLKDFLIEPAWELVLETYKKKGLGEEVALMNARVARICRWKDYDFNEKKVRLWQPPF